MKTLLPLLYIPFFVVAPTSSVHTHLCQHVWAPLEKETTGFIFSFCFPPWMESVATAAKRLFHADEAVRDVHMMEMRPCTAPLSD